MDAGRLPRPGSAAFVRQTPGETRGDRPSAAAVFWFRHAGSRELRSPESRQGNPLRRAVRSSRARPAPAALAEAARGLPPEGGTPTGCARPERGRDGAGLRSVGASEHWMQYGMHQGSNAGPFDSPVSGHRRARSGGAMMCFQDGRANRDSPLPPPASGRWPAAGGGDASRGGAIPRRPPSSLHRDKLGRGGSSPPAGRIEQPGAATSSRKQPCPECNAARKGGRATSWPAAPQATGCHSGSRPHASLWRCDRPRPRGLSHARQTLAVSPDHARRQSSRSAGRPVALRAPPPEAGRVSKVPGWRGSG